MRVLLAATAFLLVSSCTPSAPKKGYSEKQPAETGRSDDGDENGPGPADGGVSTVIEDGNGDDRGNSPFQPFTEDTKLSFALSLTQPVKWQVFQRHSKSEGQVNFSFTLPSTVSDGQNPAYLRARITGQKDWKAKEIERSSGKISVGLTFPVGGFFDFEVIVYDSGKKVLGRSLVEKVGIGEVFVVAGQSNSTNCGDTVMVPESGNVSTTDGLIWREGQDPQIGTHDAQVPGCNKGSNWPVTGDVLAKELGVPIAFASTGYSGTSISQWLPGGDPRDLFGFTVKRIKTVGNENFRAVLWHQGENDSLQRTTEAVYFANLKTVIEEARRQSGWNAMPWLVAQATFCADYHYNRPWGAWEPVRKAQSRATSLPLVFAGPDTDDLRGQHRAFSDTNCHFSKIGLTAVGERWAEKILEFLNVQ